MVSSPLFFRPAGRFVYGHATARFPSRRGSRDGPSPSAPSVPQKSRASRAYLRRAASPRRPDAVRRGSSAHWMTFLSRTSHTVHAPPGAFGRLTCPCSGRAAKSRSILRGPRMAAQPAHTSIKRNSGSVAKFIRARSRRSRRQNLPPQPVFAQRQRHCLSSLILCLVPAAMLTLQTASGSTVFQHTSLHLLRQIHH